MEPDLYHHLRRQDVGGIRECLTNWGNRRTSCWWSRDGKKTTPLHMACEGSNHEMILELLRHPEIGRHINDASEDTNETPLHVAAAYSTPTVIRTLLDAGANISERSGDLSMPFHIACSRGRKETCVELLRRGSPLEAQDGLGRTPLLCAVSSGRQDITAWLLKEGASQRASDIRGNSALALSMKLPETSTSVVLLENGADVTSTDCRGRSCLANACLKGQEPLVKMMLDAMVRSGQRLSDGGGSALHDAASDGHREIVQLLTSRRARELGISIRRRNSQEQGNTALHAAVLSGHWDIAADLLAAGADADGTNSSRQAPLHMAAGAPGGLAGVKILLRRKADPNTKDERGRTPLFCAFRDKQDDAVHLLLSRGASLFRMDYNQALRVACFYGMVQEVESLLWMEADPASMPGNACDRGDFHERVPGAVRAGILELLAEAAEGESAGPPDRLRAELVAAAKAAVKPWDIAGGGDESDASSVTSADTSSTVTNGARREWSMMDGSEKSSSSSSSDGSSDDGDDGYGRDAAGAAVSPTTRVGEVTARDRDRDSADVFVVPALSSTDVRPLGAGGSSEASPTGHVPSLRGWGQRICGSPKGNAKHLDVNDHKEGGCSPTKGGARTGFGGVKERARATLAGMMKWATSPRPERSPTPPRSTRSTQSRWSPKFSRTAPAQPSPQAPRSPQSQRSPRSQGTSQQAPRFPRSPQFPHSPLSEWCHELPISPQSQQKSPTSPRSPRSPRSRQPQRSPRSLRIPFFSRSPKSPGTPETPPTLRSKDCLRSDNVHHPASTWTRGGTPGTPGTPGLFSSPRRPRSPEGMRGRMGLRDAQGAAVRAAKLIDSGTRASPGSPSRRRHPRSPQGTRMRMSLLEEYRMRYGVGSPGTPGTPATPQYPRSPQSARTRTSQRDAQRAQHYHPTRAAGAFDDESFEKMKRRIQESHAGL